MPSRLTVLLSTLWLIWQKILAALFCYSQLIGLRARSPPALPPILARRPDLRKRAHPFTLPLKDDKQCRLFHVSYRALLPPVQPRLDFPPPVDASPNLIFLPQHYFNLTLSFI